MANIKFYLREAVPGVAPDELVVGQEAVLEGVAAEGFERRNCGAGKN